jgi:hypothetical protein
MQTVTIQIGNTDDKLTQKQWAEFIRGIDIYLSGSKYWFFGTSTGDKEWQNACWVVEIEDYEYARVKRLMGNIGKEYGQDSVAWTVGKTEFI